MQSRLVCDLNNIDKAEVIAKLLEQILDESQIQTWVKDAEGRYLYVNRNMVIADGITEKSIIGKKDDEIYGDERNRLFVDLDKIVIQTKDMVCDSYQFPNGTFEEVIKIPIFESEESEEVLGILGYAKDITAEKLIGEQTRRLAETERQFRTIYDTLPIGLSVYNVESSLPIMCNEMYAKILGDTRQAILKKKWDEFIYQGKGVAEQKRLIDDLFNNDNNLNSFSVERQVVKGDNSLAWLNITMAKYSSSDSDEKLALCLIEDITERKTMRAELERISYIDGLTNIYNRTWFISSLAERNKNMKPPYAIIMGDVNGLKICNDVFGHFEGDRLIQTVGRAFKRYTLDDERYYAVRLGGDEFLAVFPGMLYDDAKKIEARIRQEVKDQSTTMMEYSIALGTAAVKTNEYVDLDSIIIAAEEKLYDAKILESRDLGDRIVEKVIAMLRRDPLEASHMENVARYTEKFCDILELNEQMRIDMITAARLHDIGMGACTQYRLAPGKPILSGNRDDLNPVKKHSEIGYRLLNASRSYAQIANYVLHHHENIDGSGYPSGIQGEDIPIQSRIIRIVDYYDALTNPRFERLKDKSEVILELRKKEGTEFDQMLTEKFIRELILNDAL